MNVFVRLFTCHFRAHHLLPDYGVSLVWFPSGGPYSDAVIFLGFCTDIASHRIAVNNFRTLVFFHLLTLHHNIHSFVHCFAFHSATCKFLERLQKTFYNFVISIIVIVFRKHGLQVILRVEERLEISPWNFGADIQRELVPILSRSPRRRKVSWKMT